MEKDVNLNFNEKCLLAIKPDKKKRLQIALGNNLSYRVYPTGKRTFVCRWKNGKQSYERKIGEFPRMRLAEAEAKAQKIMNESPMLSLQNSRKTFRQAYKLWVEQKKDVIANYAAESKRIEQYLIPRFGNYRLKQINAPEVVSYFQQKDFANMPATRKRLIMRFNEIMTLGVFAGMVDSNPCEKISTIFKNPPQNPRPFIRAERLTELFIELKKSQKPLWFHIYLLLSLYTLCRPTEIAHLKWSWINFEELVINFPPEIMKKRRLHRVPLSAEIVYLLRAVKEQRKQPNPLVWCVGNSKQKMVNKQMISRWLLTTKLKGQLCHHGFRAIGRTWMHDQGCLPELAEDAIAHITGTVTTRAYLHSDYLEQRRPVMKQWWAHIFTCYCAGCAGDPAATKIINYLLSGRKRKSIKQF